MWGITARRRSRPPQLVSTSLAAIALLILCFYGAATAATQATSSDGDDDTFCGALPRCTVMMMINATNDSTPTTSHHAVLFIPPLTSSSTILHSTIDGNRTNAGGGWGLQFALSECCIPNATNAYLIDDMTLLSSSPIIENISNAFISLDRVRLRYAAGIARVGKVFTMNMTVAVSNCVFENVTNSLISTGQRGSITRVMGFDGITITIRNTTASFYTEAQSADASKSIGLIASIGTTMGMGRNARIEVLNSTMMAQHFFVLNSSTTDIAFVSQWIETYANDDGTKLASTFENITFVVSDSTLRPADPDNLVVGITDSTTVSPLEVRFSISRMANVKLVHFSLIIIRSDVYGIAPCAVNILWFKAMYATDMLVLIQDSRITLRAVGNLPIFSGSRTVALVDPAGAGNVVVRGNWSILDAVVDAECYTGMSLTVVDQPRTSGTSVTASGQRTAEITLMRPARMSAGTAASDTRTAAANTIAFQRVVVWAQTAGGVALPERSAAAATAMAAKIVLIEGMSDAQLSDTMIIVEGCVITCFASMLTLSTLVSKFLGNLVTYSIVGMGPENGNATHVLIRDVSLTTTLAPIFPVDVYNTAGTTIVSLAAGTEYLVELPSNAVGCYIARFVASTVTTNVSLVVDGVVILGQENITSRPKVTNHTTCSAVAAVLLSGGTLQDMLVVLTNTSGGVTNGSATTTTTIASMSFELTAIGDQVHRTLRHHQQQPHRRVGTMVALEFTDTSIWNVMWWLTDCTLGRLVSPAILSFTPPLLTIRGTMNISVAGHTTQMWASGRNWLGVASPTSTDSLVANAVVVAGGRLLVNLLSKSTDVYVVSATLDRFAVVDASTLLNQQGSGGVVRVHVACGGVARAVSVPVNPITVISTVPADRRGGEDALRLLDTARVQRIGQVYAGAKASALVVEGLCSATFACWIGNATATTSPQLVAFPADTPPSTGVNLANTASAIRAVNVFATALSLSWTPTAALAGQRSFAIGRVMQICREGREVVVVAVSAGDTANATSRDNIDGNDDDDGGKLDVIAHPLQFAVGGDDDHTYFRGAIVGNVVILYALTWTLLSLVAIIAALRRHHIFSSESSAGGGWWSCDSLPSFSMSAFVVLVRRAFAVNHVPGMWLSVMFLMLMPAVVLESTVLLAASATDQDGATSQSLLPQDVICGTLGWVVVVSCVAHISHVVLWLVPRSARAVAVPLPPRQRESRSAASFLSAAATFYHTHMLSRRFEWTHASSASDARQKRRVVIVRGHDRSDKAPAANLLTHRMYAPLYDSTRRGRSWWCLVEISVSVLMGVASGLVGVDRSNGNINNSDHTLFFSCTVIPWCLVATAIVFMVTAVLVTPYDRGLDQGLLVVLAAFTALSSVIAAVPFGETEAGSNMMFGIDIASNVLSILVLASDVMRLNVRWTKVPRQHQNASSTLASSRDPRVSAWRRAHISMFDSHEETQLQPTTTTTALSPKPHVALEVSRRSRHQIIRHQNTNTSANKTVPIVKTHAAAERQVEVQRQLAIIVGWACENRENTIDSVNVRRQP